MSKKTEIIIFILILILAAFFRFWDINSVPPGLYPDEAINGNDALNNPGRVFYSQNNGREGLFVNLIFLSFKVFGVKTSSIRLTSAIIGLLVIIGIYLLVKELFFFSSHATLVALFSSLFAATGFWPVNFSRIGFRGILTPLLLVFSFYFLFKSFRYGIKEKFFSKGVFLNLILGSVIFGLGFYSYTVFRMAVLLLVTMLSLWWYFYRKKAIQKKFFIMFLWTTLIVFLVGLPLGIYFLRYPSYFLSRAAGVSIFAQDHPIKDGFISLYKHLTMFNFRGDSNWRHNLSGSPELLWPVGLLFLLGVAVSIKYLYQSIKNKTPYLLIAFTFLFAWFFIMLSPAFLTFEGIPHSLRAIGTFPSVFIFSGIGLDTLYYYFRNWMKRLTVSRLNYFIILFSLFALLFSFIFAQYYKYFDLWGKNKEVKGAFTQYFVEIGNYLNSLPPTVNKYLVVNEAGVPVPFPSGIPMPAQTIMFIERTKHSTDKTVYLLPKDLSSLPLKPGQNVIVMMKFDINVISQLKRRFPLGFLKENNEGVWSYEVNTSS